MLTRWLTLFRSGSRRTGSSKWNICGREWGDSRGVVGVIRFLIIY